jgi:hypothetical protein
VTWQYKLAEDGEDGEVDRLHPEVNMLTRAVEAEAAKIRDAGEQAAYLRKMKRHQLEARRACDEREIERHGKAGVRALLEKAKTPAAAESPFWAWMDHVRETHVSWTSAEGPCYAKHLAQRLWQGIAKRPSPKKKKTTPLRRTIRFRPAPRGPLRPFLNLVRAWDSSTSPRGDCGGGRRRGGA